MTSRKSKTLSRSCGTSTETVTGFGMRRMVPRGALASVASEDAGHGPEEQAREQPPEPYLDRHRPCVARSLRAPRRHLFEVDRKERVDRVENSAVGRRVGRRRREVAT